MVKKLSLKLLSLLPEFIFKRVVNVLFSNKEEKELTFEEIVSDCEIIKVKLFESESDLFIQNLKKCDLYGEYGSGISTIYAVNYLNKQSISVDTDNEWVKKINNSVFNKSKLNIEHVNLGKISSFGRPENYEYRNEIKDYLNYIWNQDRKPNFVLIDGRFRVACFLSTLIYAEKETIICFDDYILRPHYHIVEYFEKPIKKNKRQAFFKVNKNYSQSEIEYYLNKFEFVME